MVFSELVHAPMPDSEEGLFLSITEPYQALPGLVVIHTNRTNRMASAGNVFFEVSDLSASEWLIKTVMFHVVVASDMYNRGVFRASTCAHARLRGKLVISYRTKPGSAWSCGDSY